MWNNYDSRITFDSFNAHRVKCGFKPYIAKPIKDFIVLLIQNYESLEYLSENHIKDTMVKVPISKKSRSQFISCVREYLRYLNIIGIPAYVPDESYSVAPPVYNPHLLTYEELNKLFDAFDTCLFNKSRISYKEYVFPLFYRMMYCCGMRPQEVTHLKKEDVDCATAEIYIRKTKCYKDRHIYVSDDLLYMIKKYHDKVAINNVQYFFEDRGKPLTLTRMNKIFKHVLNRIGLKKTIRQYDLRHAFISNTITEWIERGEKVEIQIPYITEYVGHYDFNSTYYYLHLIPENITSNAGIQWNLFYSLYPRLEEHKVED